MIEVFIADNAYLIREGLKTLIKNIKGVSIVGEAENIQEFSQKAIPLQPDVVVLNYASKYFSVNKIGCWINFMPHTKILAVTPEQSKEKMLNALDAGVKSHVMVNCSKQEITDAIFATAKGEKFFCSTIVNKLMESESEKKITKPVSCDPMKISSREMDIIKLIAEGCTNKEIADLLFLSTHTVMTHRKNIMNKLGVKNTAGIVIYAVRENIISPNKYLFDPLVR